MKRLFLWILVFAFGIIFFAESGQAADLYDSHGKRDPFVPLVTLTSRETTGIVSIESAEDINIEGIVYDPKGSVVIVNGSLMKEGQELGNIKVVKIRPDGVLFLINGTQSYVPLYRDKGEGKGK